jgi:hypothetical protein
MRYDKLPVYMADKQGFFKFGRAAGELHFGQPPKLVVKSRRSSFVACRFFLSNYVKPFFFVFCAFPFVFCQSTFAKGCKSLFILFFYNFGAI